MINEIIIFNIRSIFYPNTTLFERIHRKHQVIETIFFLWPIYLLSIFFSILISYYQYDFSFNLIQFLLFQIIYFPILLMIESFLIFIILKVFSLDALSDREIDAVIGQAIVTNCFYLIPIIGPSLSLIFSKIYLILAISKLTTFQNSIFILSLPMILSIILILFCIFCLALWIFTVIGV